jgi:hypothetical protein
LHCKVIHYRRSLCYPEWGAKRRLVALNQHSKLARASSTGLCLERPFSPEKSILSMSGSIPAHSKAVPTSCRGYGPSHWRALGSSATHDRNSPDSTGVPKSARQSAPSRCAIQKIQNASRRARADSYPGRLTNGATFSRTHSFVPVYGTWPAKVATISPLSFATTAPMAHTSPYRPSVSASTLKIFTSRPPAFPTDAGECYPVAHRRATTPRIRPAPLGGRALASTCRRRDGGTTKNWTEGSLDSFAFYSPWPLYPSSRRERGGGNSKN